MVNLVIVSHSARLGEGVGELARQMLMNDGCKLAIAAGIDDPDSPIGTDPIKVMEAIESVADTDHVLVMMDIGSALLSAETALDLLDPAMAAKVRLCAAPLVVPVLHSFHGMQQFQHICFCIMSVSGIACRINSRFSIQSFYFQTGIIGKTIHLVVFINVPPPPSGLPEEEQGQKGQRPEFQSLPAQKPSSPPDVLLFSNLTDSGTDLPLKE